MCLLVLFFGYMKPLIYYVSNMLKLSNYNVTFAGRGGPRTPENKTEYNRAEITRQLDHCIALYLFITLHNAVSVEIAKIGLHDFELCNLDCLSNISIILRLKRESFFAVQPHPLSPCGPHLEENNQSFGCKDSK